MSTKPIENEKYLECIKLLNEGMKISEIAKVTGINRSSISNWKQRQGRVGRKEPTISICDNRIYSFLLGMYLGDGHIFQLERTQRFTITNDKKYETLNNLIIECGKILFESNPYVFDRESRNRGKSLDIIFHKTTMSLFFPQHGRGKKHSRDIKLEQWQLDIIDHVQLLKGLMFSDGSSYVDNQSNILKYNFSNKSDDIHSICRRCLDILNIEYHIQIKKNANYTMIHKKSESDKLFELIGTKENPLPVF